MGGRQFTRGDQGFTTKVTRVGRNAIDYNKIGGGADGIGRKRPQKSVQDAMQMGLSSMRLSAADDGGRTCLAHCQLSSVHLHVAGKSGQSGLV